MREQRERPRIFDWDDAKAESNETKHGVSFHRAIAVFLDWRRFDIDVTRSGDGEARRRVTGMIDGKLITVVYTLRGGAVRLISARRANRKEETLYG